MDVSLVKRLMLKIFIRIQMIIKNKFNLEELKRLYNAQGNSIIHVEIYYDKYFRPDQLIFEGNYKLGKDTVERLDDNIKKYDGVVKTDYETILNIIIGKVTRGKVTECYTILDAFREGRLVIDYKNNNYLGDIALFEHIYVKALPELRESFNKMLGGGGNA
ncbi:MAG: hypothetical protein ACPLVI_04615 [Thermoplasmata archaeon]